MLSISGIQVLGLRFLGFGFRVSGLSTPIISIDFVVGDLPLPLVLVPSHLNSLSISRFKISKFQNFNISKFQNFKISTSREHLTS